MVKFESTMEEKSILIENNYICKINSTPLINSTVFSSKFDFDMFVCFRVELILTCMLGFLRIKIDFVMFGGSPSVVYITNLAVK